MERLTFKTDGLNGFSDRDLAVYGGIQSDGSEIYIGSVADKLAKYEDLEEQGKMLILPCEIGNRVYEIYRFLDAGAWEIEVHKIRLEDLDKIGKTVFLTREEAEAALKWREANETD